MPEEKSTSHKLATDVMFKLENGKRDVSKSKAAAPIIDRLHDHTVNDGRMITLPTYFFVIYSKYKIKNNNTLQVFASTKLKSFIKFKLYKVYFSSFGSKLNYYIPMPDQQVFNITYQLLPIVVEVERQSISDIE